MRRFRSTILAPRGSMISHTAASARRTLLALTLAAGMPLVLTGCERLRGEPAERPLGRHVATVQGFHEPESAQYDPDQDVWFVSSIVGYGSVKDDDGYISRVDAAGLERNDVFVRSRVNGVELHAPKGMAVQGDTLWVADIHVLRGFHKRTGAVVATVDLAPHGAVLLNAITIGPQGEVVITDSGLLMTDKGVVFVKGSRIFAVGRGRAVRVLAEGTWLIHPNGIAWDAAEQRYVVASFNPFVSEVYGFRPGDTTRTVLAKGNGRYDGLVSIGDGRFLTTSWPDSALYLIEDGRTRRIGGSMWTPADIGWDSRRQIVAVPSYLQGRVEFWSVPRR